MYCLGMFLFLREIGERIHNKGQLEKVFVILGKYTFPVYLIHWFVLDAIIHITGINTTWIIFRLGAPFVIIAVAILITWIIRKVPVIRNVVP